MSIQDLETELNSLAGGRGIATLLAQFNRDARDRDPAVGEAMVVIGEYLRAGGPGARNEVNSFLLEEGLRNGFGRAQLMESAADYVVSDERTMRELMERNQLLTATLASTEAALQAEQAEGGRLTVALASAEATAVALTGERDTALADARGLAEALDRSQEGRAVAEARIAFVEGELAGALDANAALEGTVAAYEEARHMLRMAASRDISVAAPDEATVAAAPDVSSRELGAALARAQEEARQERATLRLDEALAGVVSDRLAADMAVVPGADTLGQGLLDASLERQVGEALVAAQEAARQERATLLLPEPEELMAAAAVPVAAAEPAPDAPVAYVSTSGEPAPVVENLIDLAAIDAQVAAMALGNEARERVARAQAVLGAIGGEVAVDGLMGPQSRAGIAALDEARIAALSEGDRQAVRDVLAGVRDIPFTRGANQEVPALVDRAVAAVDAVGESAAPEAPAAEAVAQTAISHDPEAPAPEGVQAGLPAAAPAAASAGRG